MSWRHETAHEKLARLRAELTLAQDDLFEAEARRVDRMAEVHAFELEFEARVGHLIDKLAAVEEELNDYLLQIQNLRNERIFGTGYRSVDEQYRRTWHVPLDSRTKPPDEPLPPASEAQIKKLYRQLARRFHPDLASNETDRSYRTDMMQAVNDAYAARSMVELVALSQEAEISGHLHETASAKTDAEMLDALEQEILRCHRRREEIDRELSNLHNRPSVELSLEVKFAQQRGRDLLAEMAIELEQKIGRKSAERDMIKSQFNSLKQGRPGIRPD
jgi:hypothetical protein